MIQSLQDYKYYLEQDKLALGIPDNVKRPRLGTDDVWRWERLLRKREYITNCKNGLFWKIYREWIRFRFHRSSVRLGFSIPIMAVLVAILRIAGAVLFAMACDYMNNPENVNKEKTTKKATNKIIPNKCSEPQKLELI